MTEANAQCGTASWYQMTGNKTASGHRMANHDLTAAHRTAKFGTRFKVTNKRNGKSVVVKINDRGPFNKKIIDLSKTAAQRIGMVRSGTARVCLERVK